MRAPSSHLDHAQPQVPAMRRCAQALQPQIDAVMEEARNAMTQVSGDLAAHSGTSRRAATEIAQNLVSHVAAGRSAKDTAAGFTRAARQAMGLPAREQPAASMQRPAISVAPGSKGWPGKTRSQGHGGAYQRHAFAAVASFLLSWVPA